MNRIPPGLLYFTIYNPTLRPIGTISPEDEDAEEQAHILFYTSKERAVSRDRMLRQIGLAKALVNFSETFGHAEPCDNIHSQSRRMIMVSPEPNFWIHAAVEIGKSPKVAAKGKEKEKTKAKSKDKGKAKEDALPPIYDYHDGSVHDSALRAYLLRGYEQFKLTHGSLTSILLTIGQEALELQLERFFTVWAWTWDLEKGPDLGVDLGVPLHHDHQTLVPLLDTYTSTLPEYIAPVVVSSSSHLIPSSRFTRSEYPPSLLRHLLTLSPPHRSRPTTIRQATDQTINALNAAGGDSDSKLEPSQAPPPAGANSGSSTFLGMPSVKVPMPDMHLNVMDVRKWSWPGALSFGKGQGSKSPQKQAAGAGTAAAAAAGTEEKAEAEQLESDPRNGAVNVDASSLQDAMESDTRSVSAASAKTHGSSDAGSKQIDGLPHTTDSEPSSERNSAEIDQEEHSQTSIAEAEATPTASQLIEPSATTDSPRLSLKSLPVDAPEPPPELLSTTIHLPREAGLATETISNQIFYFKTHDLTMVFIGSSHDSDHDLGVDCRVAADESIRVLEYIREAIEEVSKAATATLPSATKILQPQDKHLVITDHLTDSTPDFAPRSSQFYNSQQLLDKDPNITEVFSRGQNPQHWHVNRRGLGTDTRGVEVGGDVFLEVSRKEASLTDVDNVLMSVVRRFS